jgi:hypothetical protein
LHIQPCNCYANDQCRCNDQPNYCSRHKFCSFANSARSFHSGEHPGFRHVRPGVETASRCAVFCAADPGRREFGIFQWMFFHFNAKINPRSFYRNGNCNFRIGAANLISNADCELTSARIHDSNRHRDRVTFALYAE